MARSSGEGWGWVLTVVGGLLFVNENARRGELERVILAQGEQITELHNAVMQLRQIIQEKDRAIQAKDRLITELRQSAQEKDRVIGELRVEVDRVPRQSPARQDEPSKDDNR